MLTSKKVTYLENEFFFAPKPFLMRSLANFRKTSAFPGPFQKPVSAWKSLEKNWVWGKCSINPTYTGGGGQFDPVFF